MKLSLQTIPSFSENISEVSKRIFQGEIFRLSHKCIKEIVDIAQKELEREFGKNPWTQETKLTATEHYNKLQMLRKKISQNDLMQKKIISILKGTNKKKQILRIDIPRLRGITTYGHTLKIAKPAYYFHRDTWYGNSPSQWNFWIPIQEITPLNSFGFVIPYFSKPVRNDSYRFSPQNWMKGGGYQSLQKVQTTKKNFPRLLEKIPNEMISKFDLKVGEALIFSAQHLHGTTPNLSYKTRFSLDIRIVWEECLEQKKGAVQVDNACNCLIWDDWSRIEV